MRVLIYGPAARMGGARAHLLGLVPELARLAPDDAFLLLAQPSLLADLPPLPSSWTLVAERADRRGLLGRLAWEQAGLPRLAARWGADVLLSFGAFAPLRAPCPVVLEAGNALPFTRAYWLALREAPPRVQAEEQARWLLLRASLRASARVLAPTRAMRTDVVSSLPDLAARVDVAWWGVADGFHDRAWSPPADEVVLGVSKHGINKEFDVLVDAVARLARRRPALRLWLTGTPDESPWARRSADLARRARVGAVVRFVGDVPNRQVPDLLARARLLVFPTWCESFGLPLAEALAMGAPAVAADIPACREVGGDAARYYQPGDPASLAAHLDALLDHPRQAADLGRAARARGATFRWAANAEGVLASLHAARQDPCPSRS